MRQIVCSLLTKVMRQPLMKTALFGAFEFVGNLGGQCPVTTALIVGQQGQAGLSFKGRAF